jgi:hypothetical protein
MSLRKSIAPVFLGLLFLLATAVQSTAQTATIPNPVLYFTGAEFITTGGKEFTRYHFAVDNFSVYPDQMFTASPSLPPCGANTSASRTWVDFYDQRGKRLQGFCALGKARDLNGIWFAAETDVVPPSWVYIELTDRQTNTKYKSNLADTVQ